MGYNSVVTQVAKESIKEKSSSQAENMSCRNAKETFSTQRQLQNHQIHEIKICRFLVNIFDDVGCQGHPWLVFISSVTTSPRLHMKTPVLSLLERLVSRLRGRWFICCCECPYSARSLNQRPIFKQKILRR